MALGSFTCRVETESCIRYYCCRVKKSRGAGSWCCNDASIRVRGRSEILVNSRRLELLEVCLKTLCHKVGFVWRQRVVRLARLETTFDSFYRRRGEDGVVKKRYTGIEVGCFWPPFAANVEGSTFFPATCLRARLFAVI